MTIHLVVTPFCNRNCKYCCNKQYDIQNLPVVTDEELKKADMLCLTGGEPFAYTNPLAIAKHYHDLYPKLPIIIYTNAHELRRFIMTTEFDDFISYGISGLNICIKSLTDICSLTIMHKRLNLFSVFGNIGVLPTSRIIVMDNTAEEYPESVDWAIDICKKNSNITFIRRYWQEHFVPAPDSLFRRL